MATAFPGMEFCWRILFAFYYDINHQIFCHIEFVLIWCPCLAVSRLHCNDAGVSSLLFSDFLWFFPSFFLSNQMTQTQEMHMMLNDKQKGDGLITEEEKLALRPYYYQLTKLSLSSPLSLFWHLQMSMWNFTPITNILISNILDWREKSQSLPIQLL